MAISVSARTAKGTMASSTLAAVIGFFCKEHKTKWLAGSNLFSSWRNQMEDDQRKIYDELCFGEFKHIEPSPGPNALINDDLPF